MTGPKLTPKEEDLLAEIKTGKDLCLIAQERGCTTARLYNVAAKAGYKLPPRRRGPKPRLSSETVNALHAQIGRDLYAFRNKLDYVPYKEFAEKVGMSVTNLAKAESGLHRFQLTELQRIAQVMEISLTDLLSERTVRFSNPVKEPK